MEITDTTIIAAPLEQVWDRTIDVQRLPTMAPTITSREPLDHEQISTLLTALGRRSIAPSLATGNAGFAAATVRTTPPPARSTGLDRSGPAARPGQKQ